MRYGVGRVVAAMVGCCGVLAGAAQGQVKVSQVYTGVDTSSDGPAADFIELYNASDLAVSVAGWSVQFTSGSPGASNPWKRASLSGVIPARGFYLVQITTAAGGIGVGTTLVPMPNALASPLDNPSTAGLRNTGAAAVLNTTTLTAAGVCPAGAIDLVGWRFGANTTCSEGSPVGSPSATTNPPQVVRRKCGGLTDSGSNVDDFELVGFTALRNTASALFNGITVAVSTPAGGSVGAPAGGSVTFTISGADCSNVAAGTSATANLSAIGGGSLVSMTPTGTPGEFTITTTVGAAVTAGDKTVTLRIAGPGGTYGSAVVRVTVTTPNDECAGATLISGPGPFAFNTSGATTSVDAQSFMGCDNGSSLGGPIQRDVFLRWVAPSSGAVAFSTSGTTPLGFDARLAVYAGACPPGTAPIACNDNDGVTTGTATVWFSASAGATYYLQVGATGNTATSTGSLSLSTSVTGACCPANFGACAVVAADACVNGGGVFRGVGTACASLSPCASGPSGACCSATAGCSVVSEADCANAILTPQPATWLGAGAVCQAGACPAGGSCCVGTSCSYRTQASCAALGGVWTENADALVCSSTNVAPCLPRGRCCFANGSCLFESLEANCTNAGGTWTADTRTGPCDFASACAASSTLVCCRGATCAVVATAGDCTAPAGVGVRVLPIAIGSCAGQSAVNSGCCYADFNKSGSKDVADIFAFLSAWFANSPFSDVGGDGTGTRDVSDIFQFLSAWFVGCT